MPLEKAQKKKINKGDKAFHDQLDNSDGTALTGVVVDVIGDDEQRVIVGKWEGKDRSIAYDSREIKTIGSAKKNPGPVISHPRHFFALFKKRETFAALIFAIFSGAALVWLANRYDFSSEATVIGFVIILALGLFGFNRLEAVRKTEEKLK